MIPLKFLVATTNSGKLRDFEFAAAHAGNAVALAPLPGLREIEAPPEDETTFEGNARTKAVYYSHFAPAELVLADDSGLEVDALNGAPGVRSARYADDEHFPGPPSATLDERNNLCLQQSLARLNPSHPKARYHCVLAAARDGKILCIAHGAVAGEILPTPRGTGGFGYDPLFYLPDQDCTMAELDPKVKLQFSHRGRAFAALLHELLPA